MTADEERKCECDKWPRLFVLTFGSAMVFAAIGESVSVSPLAFAVCGALLGFYLWFKR